MLGTAESRLPSHITKDYIRTLKEAMLRLSVVVLLSAIGSALRLVFGILRIVYVERPMGRTPPALPVTGEE